MQLWQIPEEVRSEPYTEDGEEYENGDDGKCGDCNWEVSYVYLMADTLDGAIEAFHENHRGLCGNCMCELLAECKYTITPRQDT